MLSFSCFVIDCKVFSASGLFVVSVTITLSAVDDPSVPVKVLEAEFAKPGHPFLIVSGLLSYLSSDVSIGTEFSDVKGIASLVV